MKNILVCLDLSDETNTIVATARELAECSGAAIRLIHVAAPDPDFVGFEAGPQTVRDQEATEIHEDHRLLQELQEQLAEELPEVSALLIQGPTIAKILEEAGRYEADLIVMGTHGAGALHHLLVGSVSEGVLKEAHVPVLLVPTRHKT